MKLELTRFEFGPDYTIGKLSVDGVYQCFTLEDVVRPDGEAKVYGKTAIPVGIYEVKMTESRKYKRIMPQIMNVPGFEGIRIHSGNTADDTEGCLIVGDGWDGKNSISASRTAANKLYVKLAEATFLKKKITIEIK